MIAVQVRGSRGDTCVGRSGTDSARFLYLFPVAFKNHSAHFVQNFIPTQGSLKDRIITQTSSTLFLHRWHFIPDFFIAKISAS